MSAIARRELINCYLETRDNFQIFWYHWPRDGIFWWEDFEPVIMVDDNEGKLCLVILRVGWKYRSFEAAEVTTPLEVIFRNGNHHPEVRTLSNQVDFDRSKKALLVSSNAASKLSVKLPDLTISGIPGYRANIYATIEEYRQDGCAQSANLTI
jgi:hypothetical protein